jgi:hypothetical protein
MCRVRSLVASLLIAGTASPAAAQTAPQPPAGDSPAPAAAPATEADLARIRRALDRLPSPLSESLEYPEDVTFRVSVTRKRFDIFEFWGEPDTAVGSYVRPKGGPWHHEFQQMVTRDEFKNYAPLSSSEQLQLAASSAAFAGAMALLGMGLRALENVARRRAEAEAREQVRRELEQFLRERGLPLPNPGR